MIHNRHVDSFANGFLANPALSFEERTGLGIIEMAKYMPISFEDYILPYFKWDEENQGSSFYFAAGIKAMPWKYEALIEKYPEDAETLRRN